MQETVKKNKTIPRGAAATKAKNKYRDSHYDRLELAVPKGMKKIVEEEAKKQGFSSKNGYIIESIKEKYLKDNGQEMDLGKSMEKNIR